MRSVITCGPGRLHFMQASEALVAAGVDVQVIQGWIPRHADWLLRLFAVLLRRKSFVFGMKRRNPPALAGRLHGCAFSDFFCEAMTRVGARTRLMSPSVALRWGWQIYGWQSKGVIRRIRGRGIADGPWVLHVRSGAGQGGAIRFARRHGARILTDHSIAHPRFMDLALRDEHARHGVPFTLGPDNPFWQLVLQDCLDADLLVVNSDFVKRTFVENGYPVERIRVVYLGVRPDFFGVKQDYRRATPSPASPLRLLFTGNFGFRKGAAPLLAAVRLLVERGLPVELTVVGVPSDLDRLLAPHRDVNLPVRFVGHVPQDELKGFFAESDLYVFPSSAEGCASSGMEAMAAGLCVVATEESGLPIRDGQNGFQIPRQDGTTLADRIAWLAERPAVAEAVGREAARLVREHFTWEQYAANMLRVYQELTA